jgi:hypothetical protein
MNGDTSTTTPMSFVHEVLTGEFGRMAPELEDDGRVQPVYLPGGRYAVVIGQSSRTTITVRKMIGRPDFDRPGLADYLLTEHSRWLLGRFERNEDALVVEHTLTLDALTPATLVRTVRAVHEAATDGERTLIAIGALSEDEG